VTASENALHGRVLDAATGLPIPHATIAIRGSESGAVADVDGNFTLRIPHQPAIDLRISSVGYNPLDTTITHDEIHAQSILVFELKPRLVEAGTIVVTGTRSPRLYEDVPIKTEVVSRQTIENAGAQNLADALKLENGLRVETNCQNCGFTQLRLLGMEGKYTQLLIDGMPNFSGLAGVYGLEQLPENLIDRIEVVKGGGSAVYGGAAVAGVVNVISRLPTADRTTVKYGYNSLGSGGDNAFEFSMEKGGATSGSGGYIFGSVRRRGAYDANDDGFSDIVRLKSEGVGVNWGIPAGGGNFSLSGNFVHEYRRGGDRLDQPAHTVDIAEELEHWRYSGSAEWQHTVSGNLDYNLSASFTYTERESFYGGLGGAEPDSAAFAESSNGYGKTENPLFTLSGQVNRAMSELTLTGGIDVKYEEINDRTFGAEAARHLNEDYTTVGGYLQLSRQFGSREQFEILGGIRGDHHSLLNDPVLTARGAFRWHVTPFLTGRLSYSEGFNPPQVFDEDLHIENVGGAQRVIVNSDQLTEERSRSVTGSAEQQLFFGRAAVTVGVTGFYTRLTDAFALRDIGEGSGGQLLTERYNAGEAEVKGLEFEAGVGYSRLTFQIGATLQKSTYGEPVEVLAGVFSDRFQRTPEVYGQSFAKYEFTEATSVTAVGRYTGPMEVPRETDNSIRWVESFIEVDLLLRHSFTVGSSASQPFEVTVGVKNIGDEYQKDLETGPERDSAFIYGPSAPRTFVFGLAVTI
jgi:outer membrane receptor for ferrienterochelin and colicins